MKIKFHKHIILSVLPVLALFSSSTEAILGGAKNLGRADAVVATPQDAFVIAFNPAGLADVENRIDVDFIWANEIGRSSIQGNAVENGHFSSHRTKDAYAGEFAFNWNWCICNWHIATGLAVYNRNYFKSTYNHTFALLGTSHLGLEYVHEDIAPTVAVSLPDLGCWGRHSFGVTLDWMIQRIKVDGIENFDNPIFSAFPGDVTNRGYDYSNGVGYTVGWLGHFFCDTLRLGATYQPEIKMRKFQKYRGLLADAGKFNIPQRWLLGIAYDIMPCLTFEFDYENFDWESVKALNNPLSPNIFTAQLGSPNGAGFGWKRQHFYRFGLEWCVNECWSLRMGYRHASAVVRRSQTVVNFLVPDIVDNFFTVGATYRYCHLEVSALYAHGFHNVVNGRLSIPVQFGGGEAGLHEERDIVGVQLSYLF